MKLISTLMFVIGMACGLVLMGAILSQRQSLVHVMEHAIRVEKRFTSIIEMLGSMAGSMTEISKAELDILRETRRIPRWCHDVESGLWRMVKTTEVMCGEKDDYHKDVRRSLQ